MSAPHTPAPDAAPPERLRQRLRRAAPFLALALTCLGYAILTDQTWEDYYITYRASKNLALGHGLVFQPGERVHSFTSPYNVLVPALLSWITGNRSDTLVLWLFRLVGTALFAGSWLFLRRLLRSWGISGWPVGFLFVLFAFECKLVSFSVNGQEAGAMLFFLSAALHALAQERRRSSHFGWALAGLMYTRPDGFVYAAFLVAGFLAFDPSPVTPGAGRLRLLRDVVRGGSLALLLYAPWLLWVWQYYGSPIPHTLLAKATLPLPTPRGQLPSRLLLFPLEVMGGDTTASTMLSPVYFSTGGWHYAVRVFAHYTGVLASLAWLLPLVGRPTRAASLASLLGHFYLTHVAYLPMPWYYPQIVLAGIVALAALAFDLSRMCDLVAAGRPREARALARFVRSAAGLTALSVLALFVLTTIQMRVQQREIEELTRKQVGLWLKQNARTPRDTVFLEPLGYIGYFSGLRMYDYPGLCSPEVTYARRRLGREDWDLLIRVLQPDWLVLRPAEVQRIEARDPELLRDEYAETERFDASERLARYRWLPGLGYLLYDRTFVVYRRTPPR